jgi:hypothetical protein
LIDTNETRIKKLSDQLQTERRLTKTIIDAALNLKTLSGNPSQALLDAARQLEKAIHAYHNAGNKENLGVND